MKSIVHILFFAAGLLIFACNQPKDGGDKSTLPPDTADTSQEASTALPDSATMMKAWETFMTPGDMHALMAGWSGKWDADIKSYMDPAAPPSESKAVQDATMIMGGLYQVSTLSGEIMGMPFEGRGTLAYDNGKKQFINSWIDNLGSGLMIMTGQWDAATKTLNLQGAQTDPVTGKDSPIRQVLQVVDDNTQQLTMYGTGYDGKEAKFMEATFKRKS